MAILPWVSSPFALKKVRWCWNHPSHVEKNWGGVKTTLFMLKTDGVVLEPPQSCRKELGWCQNHPIHVEKGCGDVGTTPVALKAVENEWGGVETTPL